jgi:hypothetical protein
VAVGPAVVAGVAIGLTDGAVVQGTTAAGKAVNSDILRILK